MITSSFLELGVRTEFTERILELAQETGALLFGEFTLASGKKSGHYFDGKMLTLHPEGAYLIGEAMFNELRDTDVDAVGGLAMAAIPIVTAIAMNSHQKGKPIPAFFVREEVKPHGTRKKIEGPLNPGSRVAIVDDVITTAGSVKKAIEAVEAVGCKVVKVIVIVDRHEGGSDRLKEEGYDFTALIHLGPTGEATISESSATEAETGSRILP